MISVSVCADYLIAVVIVVSEFCTLTAATQTFTFVYLSEVLE
jgi:hypothetical protein